MLTPYDELNGLMRELAAAAREILGDTYVGTYVQGSFALGAGDLESDRDVVVARGALDARWRPLLGQVMEDRPRGWDPADPPRPGSMAAAIEFAAYAESLG